MSRDRIITALDLGSHKVRVATLLVGQVQDLKVIGYGDSPARGIRRGQIIDLNEAVESIKEATALASKNGNVKISKVTVGLGGVHFRLINSKGSIAVSRADGEISRDDVARVLDSARAISIPANREIIHIIPSEYVIDGDEKTKDPVGMRGVRLEVNAILVLGSTPVLNMVRKAIQDSGLMLENIVYSPLATSRATLTKKQKELGSISIDIGSGSTSFSIWEESELKFASVLPVGSNLITNDVSVGLRVAPELSEKIKTEFGCCLAASVSRREQAVLTDWGFENMIISKFELARIIEARFCEILDMVGEEIKRSGKSSILPAGVVLSGGGSRLDGAVELAKKRLKLPVEIGRTREIKSDFGEVFNSDSATLAGVLLYQYEKEKEASSQNIYSSNKKADGEGFWDKIKEWFSELIP